MHPSGSSNSKGLKLKKGAWTHAEDMLLKSYIEKNGEGKWHLVSLKAGLNRCRKSCRLRWLNYLRPDIKKGDFGEDEVDLILRLHKLLGNRWSLIAGRIPGRTANDVKNYWNTHILKSRSKQQNNEPKNNELLQQHTRINIYKPQPMTCSKTINCDPPIQTYNEGNLLTSPNNGVDNAFTISSELIASSRLPDDEIKEYVDELFDNQYEEFGGKVGSSIDYSLVMGSALDVVEQKYDQTSLFDFPIDALDVLEQEDGRTNLFDFLIDDAMWEFLYPDPL